MTFGQTKSKVKRDKLNRILIPDKFDIDSTNDSFYYNQAITLASYHNYDSSEKAVNMFSSLVSFNETKYPASKFQTELKQIELETYDYYKLLLSGQWKFKWSGSSWGTDQTSKDLNKKIVFKNDSAFFYHSDTIVRQTKFVLENRFTDIYIFSVFSYTIILNDKNEKWGFSFYKSSAPYIGKTNSVAILINKWPGCACGCPEEVYEKIFNKKLGRRRITNAQRFGNSVARRIKHHHLPHRISIAERLRDCSKNTFVRYKQKIATKSPSYC